MNAEFFVLAFIAALNPKLLAVDLLLVENRRPRAMFLCVLLGGLTVGLWRRGARDQGRPWAMLQLSLAEAGCGSGGRAIGL